MRRMFAIVLIVTTVAVLFTACSGKKDDNTTPDPLYTGYSPVSTTGNNSNQANSATGATYILTTAVGKTVPALNTTRFSIAVAATAVNQTTTNSYDNVSYTTNSGTIVAPNVTTTRAIPTTWQTLPSTTTTNTTTTKKAQITTTLPRVTTTRPTPTTTEKAEPMPVDIQINDTFIDDQGRICASIDSYGWGGKLKSNSQRIPVYIDGIEMEESAMLQISSSTTGDDYQYVYLKLADYGIDISSSTVTFVIPEGFLENKTGTKYNNAYEVTL